MLGKYSRTDYQTVLPTGVTQRVDRVLDFIKTTKGQWFAPKTPIEVSERIPEVQGIIDRFHLAVINFGEIQIFLNSPAWPIDDVIEETAKIDGREDGILFAQAAAYESTGAETETPPYLSEIDPTVWEYDLVTVGFVAGFAASWEAVSDLERFRETENPGMLMLELYKLGAARMAYRRVNRERKLVIDFPIHRDDSAALGCWVDQDPRLDFYHPWSGGHLNLKPISEANGYRRTIRPYVSKAPLGTAVEIAWTPIPDEVRNLLEGNPT